MISMGPVMPVVRDIGTDRHEYRPLDLLESGLGCPGSAHEEVSLEDMFAMMLRKIEQGEMKKSDSVTKRFKHMAHHVLHTLKTHDSDRPLSRVRFGTILWWLDAKSICRVGRSMSGDEYCIKTAAGPMPLHFIALLEDWKAQGALEENDALLFIKDTSNINTLLSGSEDTLTPAERKLIEETCEKFSSVTEEERVELFSDEIYSWYKEGEEIPLELYLIAGSEEPTEEGKEWVANTAEEWKNYKSRPAE